MAKGDSSRAQNQLNYQGGTAQNVLNNVTGKMNDQYGNFMQNYNSAAGRQPQDYADIMSGYKNINSGITGAYQPLISSAQDFATGRTGGVGLDNTNVNDAIAGFKNYSQTGGFSGDDLADIRARAVSPTRSIYSSAQANLARQNALSGGYSPNSAAAQSQMARNMSQQISDADIAANANIAQMVQQGKLYGLTGMSNAALQQQANAIQAAAASNQARLGGLQAWNTGLAGEYGNQLAGLAGQRDLYGTSPGLMGTTGNQLLGAQQNLLTGSGQQNNLSLGLTGAQIQKSQIPGDFAQTMGNIGSGLGLIGNTAGAISGLIPYKPGLAGGYTPVDLAG